ncbi:hypothetical protein KL925_004431 [Ogataea polymorpha]|nr:hypothetical protein KL937_003772 [Ogataea polymorpha]KAG7925416.1 hypothetical protein KL925_004431 [Ogataea polymorpha]KAG7933673.1 hypothetical protein KL904_003933 [Ogataea polymorpha]
MFFIKDLSLNLTLHPSYFGPQMNQYLQQKLLTDVEGTCTGQFGYIICVLDSMSIDVGKGKIVPGQQGYAEFEVKYRAVVWKPFKGEVVDAIVSSVNNMGFFADVGPLSVFISKHLIPKDMKYTPSHTPPAYISEDQVIMKGSKVRIKIIALTPQELEFLAESNVITHNLMNQILSSLPDKYIEGMPPRDVGTANNSQPAAPPAYTQSSLSSTPTEYAEALYDYKPQQPEDVELRAGDKITVIQKMSTSWWKGTVGGRTGMFPANYVRLLGPAPSPAPIPQPYQQQPISPMYAPQQQPQEYTPMSVAGEPQGGQHNAMFKKFGSKLGNAAIFGAGATIGSDLVNSIF